MDSLLDQLHPVMRTPVMRWQDRCARELGLELEYFDAFRDSAAQDAAFAAKASMKRAGGSYHNLQFPDGRPCSLAVHGRIVTSDGRHTGFGDLPLEYPAARRIAVDVWPQVQGEQLTARQVLYVAAMMIAEECGLFCGGRWARLQDWCHVEMHVPGATLELIKAALAAGRQIVDLRT